MLCTRFFFVVFRLSRLRENCFPKHDIQNDGDAAECKTLLFCDVRMLADVVELNIVCKGNGSNIGTAQNAKLIPTSCLKDKTIFNKCEISINTCIIIVTLIYM